MVAHNSWRGAAFAEAPMKREHDLMVPSHEALREEAFTSERFGSARRAGAAAAAFIRKVLLLWENLRRIARAGPVVVLVNPFLQLMVLVARLLVFFTPLKILLL